MKLTDANKGMNPGYILGAIRRTPRSG